LHLTNKLAGWFICDGAAKPQSDAELGAEPDTGIEAGCSPATRAAEVAPGGWKDILLHVRRGISEDRIFVGRGGVTFYLILAIFSGIAALISIYGLFADPASIASHLDTMRMSRRAGRSRSCTTP